VVAKPVGTFTPLSGELLNHFPQGGVFAAHHGNIVDTDFFKPENKSDSLFSFTFDSCEERFFFLDGWTIP
jgi:phosphatidate phosphatase APP1